MDSSPETAAAVPAPRPEVDTPGAVDAWHKISPDAPDCRPHCPQRVKVGVLQGGTPAVRIFSDASERDGARRGMLAAASAIILGAAMLLFTSGPVLLAAAIATVVAGAAWYQYCNWRADGTVTASVFPVSVRVEWRSGWLRQSHDIDRRTVTAVRVLPRPVAWFPPAMSTSGALAALAIESDGRAMPISFMRASAAEAAGQWLSEELAVPLEVEPPESTESPVDPIRVAALLGGTYHEVPLGDGWPGTPQRIWRHDLTEHTVVAMPLIKAEPNRSVNIIAGGVGALLTSGLLEVLSGSTVRLFILVVLGVGSTLAALLVTRLWERYGTKSPQKFAMITLSIAPNSVLLHGSEERRTQSDEELWADGIELIDAPRPLMLLGSRELFGNSYNGSVALRFGDRPIPKELAALHPATAEAIAAILHEQTGMPVERTYG